VISQEQEVRITALSKEGWKVGSIARELGVHHDTVRRCLDGQKQGEAASGSQRSTLLEPWLPLIDTTLKNYPNVRATRL
jgi:transposase-like protein